MKQFNAEQIEIETASALETDMHAEVESLYPAYIGPDVHKENIVTAITRERQATPGAVRFILTVNFAG